MPSFDRARVGGFAPPADVTGGRSSVADYERALDRLWLGDGGESFVARVELARSVIER